MARATKKKTRFISSIDQVPEGYVALSSFGLDAHTRRRITAAHESGEVRAVKLVRSAGDLRVGRVFLHEEDFAAYRERVANAEREVAERTQAEAQAAVAAAVEGVSVRGELEALRKSVEDLTAALELYVFNQSTEARTAT